MITLGEVSALASTLLATEREAEEAELKLKQINERARVLREDSIPSALQELGITKLVLSTGETITIKQDVYVSIPVERRDEAYSWLEAKGFGGLIKTEVDVSFGRGELESAAKLLSDLRAKGLDAVLERGVHAQTLKAFMREQLEAGNAELSLEMFGARPVWTTKIVTPTK